MENDDEEVGKETWEAQNSIVKNLFELSIINIQMTALEIKRRCLYLRLGGEGDLRRRWGEGERRLRPGDGERRFLKGYKHKK